MNNHFRSNFNNGTQKTLPHELRAISFLINEYFLEQNFRLTAIQFAEEVEEHGLHSLESWHEVAINLRKPPSLLSLLRLYWNPSSVSQSSQISSNRDVPNCKFCEVAVQTESDQNVYTVTAGFNEYSSIEIQAKNEEISSLKSKINHLELQYSTASQNTRDLRNQLICLKRWKLVCSLPQKAIADGIWLPNFFFSWKLVCSLPQKAVADGIRPMS
ncbi:unnamed protein product [Schistosoma mattheei]|uniref:LisH domain-containing protein n=1 Tax=Schistosoma mattheei TaxID=31246 RepID=A0A3P8H4H8_9TREM|nr:unnamed protein product [Schistosoma mattheei]